MIARPCAGAVRCCGGCCVAAVRVKGLSEAGWTAAGHGVLLCARLQICKEGGRTRPGLRGLGAGYQGGEDVG